MIDVEEELIA